MTSSSPFPSPWPERAARPPCVPDRPVLDAIPDIELGSPRAQAATTTPSTRASRLVCVALLLATGSLLGLSTNLARLAGDAGLAPLAFLAWSIAGACLLLVAVTAPRYLLPPLNARTVEYFLCSAFVTVAASNLVFFAAVPFVGAAFVAPVGALPALLTYAGALVLGLERFRAVRAAGVALALTGVAWLGFLKLSVPDGATFWIVLTFAGPVLLAIGNLYRTLRWPAGLSAAALAPGMLGAAALMLFAAGLLPAPAFSLAVPADRLLPTVLLLIQTGVFTAQFVLLLELQRRGGPVYLSLIGPVGALVGVSVAVLLLGERPPRGLLAGGVLIGSGVMLLTFGGAALSRGRRGRRSARTRGAAAPYARTG